MRAIVRVLDINPKRLAYLSDIFEGRVDLVIPNRARTASYVAESDVVIGAVLVAGAKAPKLVSREMIASMRDGSVVADIAIDQGGCFETSRPTTHSEPTYVEEGVVHYCVANIPGAVARTSPSPTPTRASFLAKGAVRKEAEKGAGQRRELVGKDNRNAWHVPHATRRPRGRRHPRG